MANEPLFGFNLQQKKSLADYIQNADISITAAQIEDSGSTGRSVLAASTPAAARTAIGVGNATTSTPGIVLQAASRADSTATDVAGVNTVLNDLLAKLRTAGILAS